VLPRTIDARQRLRHKMAPMRHAAVLREFDPKRGVSISTLAWEYAAGFLITEHAHGSDQLIFAVRGVMEVASGSSVWLIPPQFALWIPARTRHGIRMPGPVSMRTLYFRPGLVSGLTSCAVLHVSPLLRELIVEMVRVGQIRTRNSYQCALRDLAIAQLKRASPIPSFVTLPSESRALLVARAVLADPAQSKSFARLCTDAGASVRTIQRIFLKEIGTDFESWRRQLRLTRAIELLVAGYSVKEIAARIGYRQPSAFVATFRRTFSTTPKAWMLDLARRDQ
jgi:AraC-like DNA-binding protein/quercetin dioxygenase-like cupin family protein